MYQKKKKKKNIEKGKRTLRHDNVESDDHDRDKHFLLVFRCVGVSFDMEKKRLRFNFICPVSSLSKRIACERFLSHVESVSLFQCALCECVVFDSVSVHPRV